MSEGHDEMQKVNKDVAVRVRCIEPGWYDNKRRYPGDVFWIKDKSRFSKVWMVRVSGATVEDTPEEAAAKAKALAEDTPQIIKPGRKEQYQNPTASEDGQGIADEDKAPESSGDVEPSEDKPEALAPEASAPEYVPFIDLDNIENVERDDLVVYCKVQLDVNPPDMSNKFMLRKLIKDTIVGKNLIMKTTDSAPGEE